MARCSDDECLFLLKNGEMQKNKIVYFFDRLRKTAPVKKLSHDYTCWGSESQTDGLELNKASPNILNM